MGKINLLKRLSSLLILNFPPKADQPLAEILLLFLVILSFGSCKSPTSPGKGGGGSQNYPVNLSVAEVSCTEAWIKLENKTTTLPVQINLTINNAPLTTITLSVQDTVIYLDSLLPNKTYTLEGKFAEGAAQQTTNNLQLTTLDTTSHNFTWQTFTFGDANAGSSILYDVAVIDDNNIWAVGEIYMKDSLGNYDPQPYNLAVWNGKNWELKKVPYYYNGQPFYGPIYSLWIFDTNDVCFGIGNMIHWDGQTFNPIEIPDAVWGPHRITKIWGQASQNFYIVGDSGSIAHYQNGTWQKIESGTTADFKDIFGLIDPNININKILAVASSTGNTKILTISQNWAKDTLGWPSNQRLIGIWINGIKTYAAGLGIWINKKDNWTEQTGENNFYSKIKGSRSNNIFAVGSNGVIHFNGSTWKVDNSIPAEINLDGLDVSNNKIAAVGFTSSGGVIGQAVIMMGTRL